MTGRTRFVPTDSLGRIWRPCALSAGHQGRGGGRRLSQIRHPLPRLVEVIVDRGFSRTFVDWVRRVCRWKVTTTATAGKGFQIHPRR